tara:strand:+ start:1708 stop:2814 length:1107 start_codon:yes stop_codon:yes gene_type:complete
MNGMKLLIVGGFPDHDKRIFGGIVRSCQIIEKSTIFKDWDLIKLDTTQLSNPAPSFPIRLIFAIKRFIRFIGILFLNKPNAALIFCSDGSSAIEKSLMLVFCNIFGCKTLIFPRAGNLIKQFQKNTFFSVFVRYGFKKSDLFLCQGESWKQFAIKEVGIPKERTKIIKNWTATKELLEVGKGRCFKHKSNRKEIIFIGWFEQSKGVFELLESIEFLSRNNNIHLSMIGDGNAFKEAEDFIERNSLEKYISLLGWKTQEEIKNLLSKSDIFVLPSWAEGFPNSVIEGMASGNAIVTTKVGVIPDILNHNENCLLVNPKDQDGLNNALQSLVCDDGLIKKLAENAISFASSNFSEHKSLTHLRSSIEEII